MKIEFDAKKGAEAITGLVQSTVDFGKKAADDVRHGVATIVEKSKAEEYARRMKKYNPLFPDKFWSPDFSIPNIIVIVDDAVRKDIDVCKGAIGWLDSSSGEEILYLYDEAVTSSGLKFIPVATCNAVYYVDNHNHNRYIQADCIFDKTLEEKVAELLHIAECVGAKKCQINLVESSASTKDSQKSASTGAKSAGASANASVEGSFTDKSSTRRRGHADVQFRGLRIPKQPTLKWFAHDDSINNLINTCCSGKRRFKTWNLELSGSTSATMSRSIACAIDGALGKKFAIKGKASMAEQAHQEQKSSLHIYLEF